MNSMGLGSESKRVHGLDKADLTSTLTVLAKNARLQNKLPEMLGELAGLCWDVVLLETRSALGTCVSTQDICSSAVLSWHRLREFEFYFMDGMCPN